MELRKKAPLSQKIPEFFLRLRLPLVILGIVATIVWGGYNHSLSAFFAISEWFSMLLAGAGSEGGPLATNNLNQFLPLPGALWLGISGIGLGLFAWKVHSLKPLLFAILGIAITLGLLFALNGAQEVLATALQNWYGPAGFFLLVFATRFIKKGWILWIFPLVLWNVLSFSLLATIWFDGNLDGAQPWAFLGLLLVFNLEAFALYGAAWEEAGIGRPKGGAILQSQFRFSPEFLISRLLMAIMLLLSVLQVHPALNLDASGQKALGFSLLLAIFGTPVVLPGWLSIATPLDAVRAKRRKF